MLAITDPCLLYDYSMEQCKLIKQGGEIMVNIKNNVNRILDYKNNRTQKDYSAKLNEMYGNNPFLDRNGKIFNEYVDYQKVLDNPNVTAAAKNYITQATGLSPSQSAKKSTYTAAPKTDYGFIRRILSRPHRALLPPLRRHRAPQAATALLTRQRNISTLRMCGAAQLRKALIARDLCNMCISKTESTFPAPRRSSSKTALRLINQTFSRATLFSSRAVTALHPHRVMSVCISAIISISRRPRRAMSSR